MWYRGNYPGCPPAGIHKGRPLRISFRTRIGLTLSVFSLVLTVSAGAFYYLSVKRVIVEQIGSRLMDVGRTGAYLFGDADRRAIQSLTRLVTRQSSTGPADHAKLTGKDTIPGLSAPVSARLMRTPEFGRTVQVLRQIKEGSRRVVSPLSYLPQRSPKSPDSPLVRFAYLLVAIPDSPDFAVTRFLADADFEEFDVNGDGKIADDEQGNAIGTVWATPADAFKKAFSAGEAAATRDWYEDKWGVWLTAAIPIKDRDGRVIAVLGVDYDTRGEASLLAYFLRVTLGAVAAGVLLSGLVSWALSRRLALRLRRLVEGVDQLAHMDMTARVEVEGNDEISRLARAFNGMVQAVGGYAEGLTMLNRSIDRFVPHAFLKSLGHESVMMVKLGDQQVRELSVLFCDIRAFTGISERLTPAETIRFLNEYLARISPVIESHGGFIDKYIGDAIMALFEDRISALRAGVEMARALQTWNLERGQTGLERVSFGIGVHHGPMVLGTVGTQDRMDGTVIADAVNVAARLESLTRDYHTTMLASAAMLEGKDVRSDFRVRYLGRLLLRGKQTSVPAFEILDALPEEEVAQRLAMAPAMESALAQAEGAGNRQIGIEKLYQMVGDHPADLTLRAVFENCRPA